MYSSLSKIADRNFVIGFFVPALLATLLGLWLFETKNPSAAPLLESAASLKSVSDVAVIAIAVWVGGLLLSILNYACYRILEGYTGPLAWIPPLRWWHRYRFSRKLQRAKRLEAEWQEERDSFPATKIRQLEKLRYYLARTYPGTLGEIKPTLFGNVIRAFEFYPENIYGADSITIWPRLASVLPKEFQETLNAARAPVDCLVNVCMLAVGATAYATVVYAESLINHIAPPAGTIPLLIGAVVTSTIAYRWAVGAAQTWGMVVKSAFDCYLGPLAIQLGYSVPVELKERTAFWNAVSQQAIYHIPMNPQSWQTANDCQQLVVKVPTKDPAVDENNAVDDNNSNQEEA
ncbi:MAG: hypothetical protein WB609_12845 [Candidatus Cybelea sp.]